MDRGGRSQKQTIVCPVFCDGEASVSCREYVGTLQSAHEVMRSKVAPRKFCIFVLDKLFVKDFFYAKGRSAMYLLTKRWRHLSETHCTNIKQHLIYEINGGTYHDL